MLENNPIGPQVDQRRMSSSMYEVFNWSSTSECPRKLTFSLAAGPGINIDEPPTAAEYQPAVTRSSHASGKGKAILFAIALLFNPTQERAMLHLSFFLFYSPFLFFSFVWFYFGCILVSVSVSLLFAHLTLFFYRFV